jgi:hypothetical protein
MATNFDDADKGILTDLITEAFRAQRMGNLAERDRKTKVIRQWYGEEVYRKLRITLREDRTNIRHQILEAM